MNRVSIASTLLASALYEPATRLLEVEFRSGEVYRYFDVPLLVYNQLLAADSKGRYFNADIRHGFPYQKIAGPQGAGVSSP